MDEEDNLLIRGKPEELADLVVHVAGAAESARDGGDIQEAVRVAMKEEWYGPWERYGPLGHVAAAWVKDMESGVPDPSGVGERSHEELVEAFTTAMYNPLANTYLGVLIAAEEGRERATLGTLFKAGKILNELMDIDPHLGVVGPGLESYYIRLRAGEYPDGWADGLLPEGQSVAADLRRILATALGTQDEAP
jgi:hypothetical protein